MCIADLETINEILRERPTVTRVRTTLKMILEQGVECPGCSFAEGDEWRRQRRLVVTALNSNHLNRYFHVVHTSTERLHRQLKELTHFRKAFDIGRELTSCTVDIASALAFGSDLNTLERRNNVAAGAHSARTSDQRPADHHARALLALAAAACRSRRGSLALAIRRAVERFIEQARERMAERPELREAPENFLEGMLAAQEAEGAFTDDEIIGNTFTLLLAGEDTTAHTMAWTMSLLADQTGDPGALRAGGRRGPRRAARSPPRMSRSGSCATSRPCCGSRCA